MRNFFMLFLLVLSFGQCKKEEIKKEPIKTTIEKPKVKKEVVKEVPKEKETDTINKKNVVPFLKAYGKLHKPV